MENNLLFEQLFPLRVNHIYNVNKKLFLCQNRIYTPTFQQNYKFLPILVLSNIL